MATGEGDGVVVVAAVAMEMEAGLGAAVMARIGQVFRCSRTEYWALRWAASCQRGSCSSSRCHNCHRIEYPMDQYKSDRNGLPSDLAGLGAAAMARIS